MFFDMTSMPIQDQIRAQTAAQKFLKTQMTPSDLMAIMTFSSDLKVLQDFTDDRDALSKIIKGLTIGEGSDLAVDGSTGADNEEDTGAAYTADDTEFNIFNTDRKLVALESAARMLGALPEKKALVYFASGVTKTGVDNEAQLRATINAAIRNNVAFFPIDARGLVAAAPLGDATKGSPGSSAMYGGSSARSQQASLPGPAGDPLHAGRRHRRQGAARQQRSRPRHRAGAEGNLQLLHPGLLQRQRQAGRPLPPHQVAAHPGPSGQDRQARLPARLLRRQGVRQVQLLRQRAPVAGSPHAGRPDDGPLRRPGSGLLPHGPRPLFRSRHRQDSGLGTGTGPRHAASTAPKSTSSAKSATPRASCRATSAITRRSS